MKTGWILIGLLSSVLVHGQPGGALPVPIAGNVTLPLDDYNQMIELAGRTPKGLPTPPLAYSINSADLNFQSAGELLAGTIRLEGEVFSTKPAVAVPLLSGVTVFDAEQQGRDLPLKKEGATTTAVLRGPGAFSISMNAGLAISMEAGRAALTFPAPGAGTVRLTLAVPGEHTNVDISPGLITERRSANGRTTIEATLVPSQPTAVWWETRENPAPAAPREVRFLSDVKTLVSVSRTEVELAALADITVVQGEPGQFELQIPEGYELTGASGPTLESSEVQAGVLILKAGGTERQREFLITIEKAISGSQLEVPILSLRGTQRETGEVLVEGEGALELTAKESGGLQRMDVKETNPYLRAMAQNPPQAAFRYHRQPSQTPCLSLEWMRFPDSQVLAALAQKATVTTLVTPEGRSLTEVKLLVRNQAQPFLKVDLPAGAVIVSAEVAGQTVKPVQGPDGNRVPLLRTGFRPKDSYPVSFVFLHSGVPFARKGGSELTLPKMDVPIGMLEWEVFLPRQYKVADFGGDVLDASLLGAPLASEAEDTVMPVVAAVPGNLKLDLHPGQLGGFVVDPTGAVVVGSHITVTHVATGETKTTYTDLSGRWMVSDLPPGRVRVSVFRVGFRSFEREGVYDPNQPERFDTTLQVGTSAETVTVEASAMSLSTAASTIGRQVSKPAAPPPAAPSTNVTNLQRRVAGVLPIRVDVPRAGSSFQFARTLVVDQETKVTFRYKTR